jgi:hypothetical protein
MQTPEEIARDILRWAANQDRDFGGALEIEWVDRIADALRRTGAAERERCLAAIDGLYHGDACRAALRSLD